MAPIARTATMMSASFVLMWIAGCVDAAAKGVQMAIGNG